MKTPTLTAKDRRALVIGAIVLAPGLFYIWGVKPYVNALTAARQELSVERETLGRERAAVAQARKNPLLQHIADSAMTATAPRLFTGRDDVIASAELASYLGEIARTHHVWLQDAGTRPATLAADGVRALHVEIRAESDIAGVMAFLQALESGAKLVRVDRIDVTRQARASANDGIEALGISASITGYALGALRTDSTRANAATISALPSLPGAP
jgi:hypothetical protein